MEPVVCGKCIGMGYVTMCGGELRACPVCNGTGKVWPSVEAEQVFVFASDNAHEPPTVAPDKLSVPWMVVPRSGRYRIIVQPLKEGE